MGSPTIDGFEFGDSFFPIESRTRRISMHKRGNGSKSSDMEPQLRKSVEDMRKKIELMYTAMNDKNNVILHSQNSRDFLEDFKYDSVNAQLNELKRMLEEFTKNNPSNENPLPERKEIDELKTMMEKINVMTQRQDKMLSELNNSNPRGGDSNNNNSLSNEYLEKLSEISSKMDALMAKQTDIENRLEKMNDGVRVNSISPSSLKEVKETMQDVLEENGIISIHDSLVFIKDMIEQKEKRNEIDETLIIIKDIIEQKKNQDEEIKESLKVIKDIIEENGKGYDDTSETIKTIKEIIERTGNKELSHSPHNETMKEIKTQTLKDIKESLVDVKSGIETMILDQFEMNKGNRNIEESLVDVKSGIETMILDQFNMSKGNHEFGRKLRSKFNSLSKFTEKNATQVKRTMNQIQETQKGIGDILVGNQMASEKSLSLLEKNVNRKRSRDNEDMMDFEPSRSPINKANKKNKRRKRKHISINPEHLLKGSDTYGVIDSEGKMVEKPEEHELPWKKGTNIVIFCDSLIYERMERHTKGNPLNSYFKRLTITNCLFRFTQIQYKKPYIPLHQITQ